MSWQLLIVLFITYSCNYQCTSLQLSCEQIRAFVEGHNIRRQRVAQGLVPRQPPASNMLYMIWDEELAEKAARWANNGIFGHNPDRTIASKRWNMIGENIYISNVTSNTNQAVIPNIQEALDFWFNEHQNYGFEPFVLGTEKPIAHYTQQVHTLGLVDNESQMVWADTSRVGCGISQRNVDGWTSTLFVCDYGPMGNYFGQVPYKTDAKGYLHCDPGMCNKPYGIYC